VTEPPDARDRSDERPRSRAARFLPVVLGVGLAGWGAFLGLVVGRSGTHEARAPAESASVTLTGSSELVAPKPSPATSRELDRMLADRPAMRPVLEARPSLVRWITNELDATSELARVEWDPAPPRSGQPSEYELGHVRADARTIADAAPTKLRISDAYTGVDQVGLVLFELLNRRNAKAISEAWSDAMRGKMGRDAFALSATRIEHRALVALHASCDEHGLVPGPSDVLLARSLEAPLEFDAYLAWAERLHRAEGSRYDPVSYWRRAYEARGAP
jgi:hypothetical protein